MLFAMLLLFFVILNGRLTWEILLTGAVVCALADVLACRVLGWNGEKSKKAMRLAPAAVSYIALLLKEMVRGSVRLIGLLLCPAGRERKSGVFTYESALESDFAVTVLANGISLVPGTYTVETDGGKLTIHALEEKFFDTVPILAERIEKIEKKEKARR